MTAMENTVICNCRQVTLVDIERAMHSHRTLPDVEAEFREVQQITGCSTGCGGCMDKIKDVISDILNG